MRIPLEKIEEIRSATDIVELVSSYVRLKRRGKNYVGLCPFHAEKTPSFTVSPERQMYHCFGCGAGGNVFTFMMAHEKISFIEAVRILAERAGIELPAAQSFSGSPESTSDAEALYSALREAAVFFHRQLTRTDDTSTPDAKAALEYLHRRGWRNETIKRFGIGYSPRSWDALIRYMVNEKGFSTDLLEQAGLVIRREDGTGYYDRFRGRIVFPIFSVSGRVIGFGARKFFEDDTGPKYINSPETQVYVKSRVLYGLAQSREAIRRCDAAILVEGYADLITLFQAGIENVVASSGTALTVEQVQLLQRYTKNVIFVYDADSAGAKAMLRGLDLMLEQNLEVKIVELPQGEDPDSFLKSHSVEEFRTLLNSAISWIDFKMEWARREVGFDDPGKQAEAIRSVLDSLARISDELKRDLYIKRFAEKYDIYETLLRRELEQQLKQRRREVAYPPQTVQRGSSHHGLASYVPLSQEASASLESKVPPKLSAVPPAERNLLKLLLEAPDEVSELIAQQLSLDDISSEAIRTAMSLVLQEIQAGRRVTPAGILDMICDTELTGVLTDIVMSSYDLQRRYEISPKWGSVEDVVTVDVRKIARDSLYAIKRSKLEEEIERTEQALRNARQQHQEETPYLQQLMALQQQRQSLERAFRQQSEVL